MDKFIKLNSEDKIEEIENNLEEINEEKKEVNEETKEKKEVNEETKEKEEEAKEKEEEEKKKKLEENEMKNMEKDFEKINQRQKDKILKEKLLIKVFKILNYDVEKLEDLISITLQRELLKGKQVTEKILKLVPELRKVYNSSYLTCLHDNSIFKQKNPVINLVRQLLKCNYLLMTPKVVSNGYDKASGKKLVTRIFIIEKELF